MGIYNRNFFTAYPAADNTAGNLLTSATLAVNQVDQGSFLAMEVTTAITTSTATVTIVPQVSPGGASPVWYDLHLVNNPSNVAGVAGTGSLVTSTYTLAIPESALAPYMLVRCQVAYGGGATTGDTAAVTFRYVQPGGVAVRAF